MDRAPLGVIFDMDGVLVDSAEAHYQAWCLLGEEVGKPHARGFFAKTFGMHNREIIPLWLGSGLHPEEVERLSARKEALYRQVAATSLQPLDGVTDLIRALEAEGFLLAVGSSGPPPNIDLALGILGLRDAFSAVSTAADVSEGKPNPEVFLKAAERLGIPASRCAVVEDAPQGIEAGRRAGSKVIAIASTRPPEELSGADILIRSFSELHPERVRRLIIEERQRP